ncbi:MAG: AAA family ATPase [Lachnospiraceae bacterium]|nr:AAA family ATPase [Lachnospiraceae bacterium]
MSKVIAIANQKGGVGKTTTTVNLGIGLVKAGKKVLLIDADSQGSLTASLGYDEPDEIEVTLATNLAKVMNEEEIDVMDGILSHEENIDILPCNIELSGLEVSMVNAMRREYILKEYIDGLRDQYDYILIDCMPSLGMVTMNALTAADTVLIPVQAAYLPLKGLEQLIKTIGRAKKYLNPKLGFEGILITMVDKRKNFAKDISEIIRCNYGQVIHTFDSVIPSSVRAEEISAEGVSIFKHDPRGKVAKAYEDLAGEVLANE